MPRKTGEKINETLIKEIQTGDRKSFEEMFIRYMSLAKKIAKNYFDLGVEEEDIISSSLEGLVLGINKLVNNETLKNKFRTLKNEIIKTIELNILENYGISLDNNQTHIKKQIIAVLIAKRDLKKTLKRNPTQKEISEHTKINEYKVNRIIGYLFKDSSIEYNESHKKDIKFLDLEENIINAELLEYLIEQNLTKLEKECLQLHKLGLNYKDIALQLNITRQKVGSLIESINFKISFFKTNIANNKHRNIINYQNNKKTLAELLNMLLEGNLEVLEIIYNRFIKLYKNKIDKNIRDTLKNEEIDKKVKKAVNYSLRKNLISQRIDTSEIIRIIRVYLEEIEILRAKKHNNKNKQKSINELLEEYKEKKDKKTVINKILRKYKYYLENIIDDYLYLGVNTEEIYYITYKTIIFTIEYSIKNNIQNFEEVLKFYIEQSMIELFSNIYEIEIDNEILKIMRDIKEYEIKFIYMKGRRPTVEEIIKEVKIPSEKLEKIINIININNLEKPHLVPRLKEY